VLTRPVLQDVNFQLDHDVRTALVGIITPPLKVGLKVSV
jgi:hypothetical protein